MDTLKQIVLYIGGMIMAIVIFHIFIIGWMTLTIMVSPEQVAHIAYWDGLLQAMIRFLN